VQDEFLENGVGGAQNLASLTRIPGAGHLVRLIFFYTEGLRG
jgi:hypothetical protein